jgi:signal recognition particle GTPase
VPLLVVAHLPDTVQLGGVRHYRGLLSAPVAIAAQKQPQKRNAKPKQIQNTHTQAAEKRSTKSNTARRGSRVIHYSHPHTHTHTQLNSLHASAAPAIKTSQRTNKSKEDDDHTFAKTRGQLVSAAVASETIFSVLTKKLSSSQNDRELCRPPARRMLCFFLNIV